MFLLVTANKNLSPAYDNNVIQGITYLGYTNSEKTAKKYAKQFSSYGVVYYVDKPDWFIEGINKVLNNQLNEIIVWVSEDGDVSIALTVNEIEYLEDVLSDECDTEFDDLRYAIETLSVFNDKRIVKMKNQLEKIYKLLNDPDDDQMNEFEDVIENVDIAKRYSFLASRTGLFRYNYNTD